MRLNKVIYNLIMTITGMSYGSYTENRTSSRYYKTHTATSDLLNSSIHSNVQHKIRFQDRQYYDPVLTSHSALVDYIKRLNEKVVDDVGSDGSEQLSSRRKRSTGVTCVTNCERSLCPWTVHWNEDPARVPQFIKYAKCETNVCDYSFAELGLFALFKLGMASQCETVRKDIYSTKNGEENWITDWPIACLCAKSWIHESVFKPVYSGGAGVHKPEFSWHALSEDAVSVHDSEHYGHQVEEGLTDAQRKQLMKQEKKKKQHSETFLEVMRKERKRNKKKNINLK